LHPIPLGELVPRVRDGGLQLPVVGEHHQALAVGIEASGGVDAGHAHEVGEAGVAALGRELADHAEGLVEKQKATHGERCFRPLWL